MRGESLQSGLGASSATTIMQSRLTPPAALTGKGSSMRANAAARVAQSFSAKAYENGPGTCLSGCLPVLMRSNGGGGPSEDRRMQENASQTKRRQGPPAERQVRGAPRARGRHWCWHAGQPDREAWWASGQGVERGSRLPDCRSEEPVGWRAAHVLLSHVLPLANSLLAAATWEAAASLNAMSAGRPCFVVGLSGLPALVAPTCAWCPPYFASCWRTLPPWRRLVCEAPSCIQRRRPSLLTNAAL